MGKRKRRRAGNPTHEAYFGDLLDARPVATLDLHGDTAVQAERRVRDFIVAHARISRGQVVHIITGRGLGSRRGPVLPGVVRRVLTGDVARFVEEFDRDLDEAGYLVRMAGSP